MSETENQITTGKTVLVEHNGLKKRARVVRAYTHEEIVAATQKAAVVTEDAYVLREPTAGMTLAAEQREHPEDLTRRALAFLTAELDWFHGLHEEVKALVAAVFLDIYRSEGELSSTVLPMSYAVLEYAEVLKWAATERRVYSRHAIVR